MRVVTQLAFSALSLVCPCQLTTPSNCDKPFKHSKTIQPLGSRSLRNHGDTQLMLATFSETWLGPTGSSLRPTTHTIPRSSLAAFRPWFLKIRYGPSSRHLETFTMWAGIPLLEHRTGN